MNKFKNDHTIQVMMSTALKGKAPQGFDWGEFHKTFKLTNISPRGLAKMVYAGYSFAPVFRGRRKEGCFSSAWHIAFDFDNPKGKLNIDASDEETALSEARNRIQFIKPTGWERIKIVGKKNNLFVVEYEYGSYGSGISHIMRDGSFSNCFASFAYSTPSSSIEQPKTRVVFIFDKPILQARRVRDIYQAIAWRFCNDGSICDPQCKDPLRLYFGSENCELFPNWSVISDSGDYSMCQMWIDDFITANPTPKAKNTKTAISKSDVPDGLVRWIVNRLSNDVKFAIKGEKHLMRRNKGRELGGYVAAGYIDKHTAESLLIEAALLNTDNAKNAEREIKEAITYGMKSPLYIEAKRKISAGNGNLPNRSAL